MSGRVIHDKEGADVANEVDKAFSSKPCLKDISSLTHEQSTGPLVSSMCLKWTKEQYGSLTPAVCQACKKSSLKIKAEESLDYRMEEEEHFVEPKVEIDFDSHCLGETDLKHSMEGDFAEGQGGQGEYDVKEEEVSNVSSNELPAEDSEKRPATRYVCKICNKVYKGWKSFQFHRNFAHKVKTCLECKEEFASYNLIKAHFDSVDHHGLRYKCDFCDEGFNNTVDRLRHVKEDHKVQDDATIIQTSININYNQYNCPLCHESFGSDKYGCWGHLRSIHREESEGCEVESCRYACVGKQLMFHHIFAKHKRQGNSNQVIHTCDICMRQISQSQLIMHYRKDHNLTLDDGCRFVCQHCGKVFKIRNARADHINEAHLKVSYNCDKCGKCFKRNKSQLHQHMQKVHMKESQKKQCHICQEWRKDAEELATHVRKAHTGEKPFPCIFCQESFYSAHDAHVHRRYKHVDSFIADQKWKAWLKENCTKDPSEYKMKCHLCSEVMSTLSDLRRHWDEVHPGQTDIPDTTCGAKKYICELCGVALQSNILLKIHTFENHEPEATKCPICPEQCPSRDEAIVHTKEHLRKPLSQKKTSMCEHCAFVGTKGALKIHLKIHDKSLNRPTICTYCEKEFPKYENMTRHRRIAHREQWNLDKDRLMAEEGSVYQGKHRNYFAKFVKKSTCAVCGVTLCSRAQLHLHMKARHGAGLPDYGLHRGRQKPEPPEIVNKEVMG